MTGGERLAKVAEVLAGHWLGGDTAQANSAAGLCACGTRFYENGESPASALAAWRRLERAHAAHVAQALAPLLDTFRAEDEARGAGRVREVFAALLPGFEADYGVQSSPVARLRAALADGEGGE